MILLSNISALLQNSDKSILKLEFNFHLISFGNSNKSFLVISLRDFHLYLELLGFVLDN